MLSGEKRSRTQNQIYIVIITMPNKIFIPIDKIWQGNENNQGVRVVGTKLFLLLFLTSCNIVFITNKHFPPKYHTHIPLYSLPTATPPFQSRAILFHAWTTAPNWSLFNPSRLQMLPSCLKCYIYHVIYLIDNLKLLPCLWSYQISRPTHHCSILCHPTFFLYCYCYCCCSSSPPLPLHYHNWHLRRVYGTRLYTILTYLIVSTITWGRYLTYFTNKETDGAGERERERGGGTLVKLTQLENGRTWIWTQADWLQGQNS